MLFDVIVEFEAELWLWEARRTDNRTFVSLPEEVFEDIRELTASPRPGFGAVRVQVRIGASLWRTSIFPDDAGGRYVLPIKRAVCQAESLQVGDTTGVTVELIEI